MELVKRITPVVVAVVLAYDFPLFLRIRMHKPPLNAGKSQSIDLAHQPDFCLGLLDDHAFDAAEVASGGAREILEIRVMVLVALHLAVPEVVSRDDLIARCWEGRVGDDAITGAIGKLRRLAGSRDAALFAIETIRALLAGLLLSANLRASTRPATARS